MEVEVRVSEHGFKARDGFKGEGSDMKTTVTEHLSPLQIPKAKNRPIKEPVQSQVALDYFAMLASCTIARSILRALSSW